MLGLVKSSKWCTTTLTLSRVGGEGAKEDKQEGGGKLHPWGPGLEPGTYHVLGRVPSGTPREFRQASLSVPIDRVGPLRNTTCCVFWR